MVISQFFVGLNPAGLKTFFEELQKKGKRPGLELFSTHPLTQKRIDELQKIFACFSVP